MNKTMKVVKLNPTLNSTRHTIKLEKSVLLKTNKIFKNTLIKHQRANGRSPQTGHITAWHRGGGMKRLYRKLDLTSKPNKSLVLGISADPNRKAFISTNFNLETKQIFNTIATHNIFAGALIQSNILIKELKLGYKTKISNIPLGTIINNISLTENSTSKYVRAAGTSAQLLQLDKKTASIKLPSNTIIKVPATAYATIGSISNEVQNLTQIGKAGRNRNLNRRPIVRGVAMNPVDHPHGGNTSGGRPSVTPWGLPTKGKFYLKRRKHKNKK